MGAGVAGAQAVRMRKKVSRDVRAREGVALLLPLLRRAPASVGKKCKQFINKNALGQAPRRHPEMTPYRCCLPTLAGFEGLCRAGPTQAPKDYSRGGRQ